MNAPFSPALAMRSATAADALSSRAMLAGLHVTQWTARKMDKGATANLHASTGAAHDAGRYNKALIAGSALAEIQKAATAARDLHYTRTLPWLDSGARILPAEGYATYSAEMRTLRIEFEAAVERFCANYEAHRDAAAARLGSMFDATEYPPLTDIRRRFSFGIRILPMPAATDFRVELANGQADLIRAEIEESAREALREAMADAWTRISTVVGTMAEKLRAYKPATPLTKAEGIFRDSLVSNVAELVELLPAFNLTGDARLAEVIERMRDLCAVPATTLREDEAARSETADMAAAILADVSAYLA